MKIPNTISRTTIPLISLARIVSEDSQLEFGANIVTAKSSKDS